MRYLVTVGEHTLEVEVTRGPDGVYGARAKDGAELQVSAQTNSAGVLDLRVNNQTVQVLPSVGEVRFQGQYYAVRTESWLEHAAIAAGGGKGALERKVLASMPGRIVQIACQVGQAVTVGAPLVVMEAMKMQNELSAQCDGVVRVINVSVGQTVERGELLVELE
jgi:biotin carboxyl carrier protein